MQFTHLSKILPPKYSKAMCVKGLWCNRGHDEHVLKNICIERLTKSIRDSMHLYWSWEKTAAVHDQAEHAPSLTELQHVSGNIDASYSNPKTDTRCGNTRSRGMNIHNINSNSSSSIKLSNKNSSSCWSLHPSTAMLISHLQQQRVL